MIIEGEGRRTGDSKSEERKGGRRVEAESEDQTRGTEEE